jgi:hypothetical protein
VSDLLAVPVPTPATPALIPTDGGGNDGTDSDNKGSVVMRLMKISNFLQ